jgi:glycosyltransferase involved in cell wall biosynthesis
MSEISLIIRTYHEEKWIGECLRGVLDQTIDDIEVILVDNQSTDKTVEKAKNVYPDLTIVEIDQYYPGLALNKGIRASSTPYFVCLSAHCIPVDEHWLEHLWENFDEYENIAGVYGRQVPLESSDPIDKRDLFRTFGPEKRVQTQDTFFHNANSMIRRDVWDEYLFDEEVTNIEDQIWANEVLNEGYKIVYEPEAAVYHHHGINQGNDAERMRSVVRTMENNAVLDSDDLAADFDANPLEPSGLDIVSFIPIRQQAGGGVDSNEALIQETIGAVDEAEYVDDVFLTTDVEYIADNAEEWGASDAILRPPELSETDVGVVEVYKYTLEQLEESGRYPDLVLTADITHPLRPTGLIDDIIVYLVRNGYDTVVAVYPEYRPSWVERDGELQQLNEATKRLDRNPVQIGMFSLGAVMYPHVLRREDRLAGDFGVYEVENPLATIEIRERQDLKYWEELREVLDVLDEADGPDSDD